MNLSLIPVWIAVAIGVAGFGLMMAAFAMISRRGGCQHAMPPDAEGHWPPPRKIMFAGALLGALFGLLLLVPGVVPWWDYGWCHGVIFGFVLCSAIQQILPMARKRCSARSREPEAPSH